MQDTVHLLFNTTTITTSAKSSFPPPPPPLQKPLNDFPKKSILFHLPTLSSSRTPTVSTTISLPPAKPHHKELEPLFPPLTPPSPTPPTHNDGDFQEKMLFLDSIGLDIFSLITHHRPILLSSSLQAIKSTFDYLLSTLHLSSLDLRRLISMCPDILSLSTSSIAPVLTFLLREARVDSTSDLKRVICRRPRLLVSSVSDRLRPTLYFLQSIGISETHKHTYLLSCSVEDKLLPRIHYFQGIGFPYRDAVSMFRRFPQLFNYSVKDNIEPKLNYFVVEMGRDLKELKEFPHYFSFSLENRIKPRHRRCVERGVCFSLPALLKTSEAQFRARLEVCCDSSIPFRTSPLSCHVNSDDTHSDSNITD